MYLTRLAISRPISTLMIWLVVVMMGLVALKNLGIDLTPDVTYPTISVLTYYEGAGPEEVEARLTRPLEQAFSSISGVEHIFSSSTEGSSQIFLRLRWGQSLDSTIGDIRQAIDKSHDLLPRNFKGPYIRRYDVNDRPILYVGLVSELSPLELTQLTEKQIVPQLERLEGVGQVRLRGAVRREIQVELRRAAIEARQVVVGDVVMALRRENITQPAGDIAENHLKWLVRSQGEFTDLDQIRNTVVRRDGEKVVRVKDIANVVDGIQERTEIARTNGKPGLMMYVVKQSGENTIEVSDQVQKTIQQLNQRFPSVELVIRVDNSEFIRQAIKNLGRSAFYGMSLAVLVLIVFLRSFRSSLVIAAAIPVSVLAAFVLIYFKGFTLNMISFGAIALGIGMLVDNSIVVLESIFYKIDDGVDLKTAAVEGSGEVAMAITASTATTLVVFFPLLFVEGIAGVLLHQLAWVVTIILLCSLLVSLTLTPMLATVLLSHPGFATGAMTSGNFVASFHRFTRGLWNRLDSGYRWVLEVSMVQTSIFLTLVLLVCCVIVGLSNRIGTEFLPKTDEGDLDIYAQMTPGIDLETLDHQSKQVEASLHDLPEKRVMATFVGDDAKDGDHWHTSRFRLKMLPRRERTKSIEELRSEVTQRIGNVPGMTYNVQVRSQMALGRMLRGLGGGQVSVDVLGYDLEVLNETTDQIVELMKEVPGLINVHREHTTKRPVLAAAIDRAKASLMGVSVRDISQTLETAIGGTRATVFRDQGDEFDVRVRLQAKDRSNLSKIEAVLVRSAANKLIPLVNVIEFDRVSGDVEINRRDQQRSGVIYANVEDRDLGSTVSDLDRKLRSVPLPQDVSYHIAGDWEHQQRSFADMRFGFGLAVILMYMVMAAQFESFRDPLLIMLTVPLSGVGVIAALLLTHMTFNVQSFIGIIVLAGIVVNNSIVLVDYINRLRRTETEESWTQLLVTAGSRRLRPIVMTTLTTTIAMLPLALGWGEGGELQAPMATVVIGGLLAGMLVSLGIIPVVYRLFYGLQPQRVPHP